MSILSIENSFPIFSSPSTNNLLRTSILLLLQNLDMEQHFPSYSFLQYLHITYEKNNNKWSQKVNLIFSWTPYFNNSSCLSSFFNILFFIYFQVFLFFETFFPILASSAACNSSSALPKSISDALCLTK